MDLGLQFEELKSFSCVLDTVTRREESQEAIVSDSMPDIGDVIAVTGTPYLHQTRIESSMVIGEGEVSATVIYAPEHGGDICTISVRVPFRCSVETDGVNDACKMNVMMCMHSVDVKVLNPRKVLVQSEISMRFLVYSERAQKFSVATDAHAGIQSKTEHVTLQYISQVTDKVFPVEENLTIAAGRRGAERLISCDYVPYCTEAKLIGRKVVFKGGVKVCTKFLTEDGVLTRETTELAISQVLDAGSSSENAVPRVNLAISDAECALTERGDIAVMLEIYASAMLIDQISMDLVTDAYSTQCRCDCNVQMQETIALNDHGNILHPFRQILNTEIQSAEVLMEQITMAEILNDMAGKYRCRLKVSCCLKESDNRLINTEQNCYVDLPLPCAMSQHAIWEVQLLEAACISAGGGMELRGVLHLSYLCMSACTVKCLTSVTLNETDCDTELLRPSAVLRRLRPGETLWDLGKANCATVEEIMLVNQISDEHAAGSRFLLIPRSR